MVEVVAAAGRFYQSRLSGSWVPGLPRQPVGLDAVLLPTSPWKIGYAPADWTALLKHLRGLGFSDGEMLAVGLVTSGKKTASSATTSTTGSSSRCVPKNRIAHRVHRPPPDPASAKTTARSTSTLPTPRSSPKGRVLAGLAEGSKRVSGGVPSPSLTEGPPGRGSRSASPPPRPVRRRRALRHRR